MTNKDIDFFQGIINDILRYITSAEIQNEAAEQQAQKKRALFKFFSPAVAGQPVALQLETKNRELWTAKELEIMPFLKELTYRKVKNGLHQFRYRRLGYDVAFTSKSLDVAKKKARAFITGLKKQQADFELNQHQQRKNAPTLSDVAKLWFDNKKRHVVIETLRTYQSVYENHIKPRFGSLKIKSILPMHLQPFFNELAGSLGKTCENSKIILNGIFDFAVANRLCPSSPMPGVVIERHYRKTGKALTDEQIKRFRNVMLNSGAIGTAYLIILYAGIRGAELESLSFDWENGTFTVNNAKLKKSQRVHPENIKRTVPIFPGLYALKERIENDAWIMDARTVSNGFCRLWTESSVKDLRHTFTTKARESGIENELVNLWTGHLPGRNVTANVYTHFSLEFQKDQAKKLNNY